MPKDEPMPHYERLLTAASNQAGRYFLGHCVVRNVLRFGGLPAPVETRSIVPMWSSKSKDIEPELLRFMRQLFGAPTKEGPRRK